MRSRWNRLPILLAALMPLGCGTPGKGTMSEADREALIRPEAAKDGYGTRVKRAWPPAVEAAYQKLRDRALGENHFLIVTFGMSGEWIYDGMALYWDGDGPFRAVRTEARYAALDQPVWKEEELPREEGMALLQQVNELDPFHLGSDDSLRETVLGEGAGLFRLQLGVRENEALVWAPFTLADRGKESAFRDLLLILRMVAPAS